MSADTYLFLAVGGVAALLYFNETKKKQDPGKPPTTPVSEPLPLLPPQHAHQGPPPNGPVHLQPPSHGKCPANRLIEQVWIPDYISGAMHWSTLATCDQDALGASSVCTDNGPGGQSAFAINRDNGQPTRELWWEKYTEKDGGVWFENAMYLGDARFTAGPQPTKCLDMPTTAPAGCAWSGVTSCM